MKQYIRSLGETDQVFAEPRITREHNGPALIVYAIAEGRFDELTMIYVECRDLEAILFVDHTLCDLPGNDCRAYWRNFLVRNANPKVGLISLLQITHHLRRSLRAIHTHRLSPETERGREPSRQPKIRKAHDVVGVEVSEKHGSHIPHGDMKLPKT